MLGTLTRVCSWTPPPPPLNVSRRRQSLPSRTLRQHKCSDDTVTTPTTGSRSPTESSSSRRCRAAIRGVVLRIRIRVQRVHRLGPYAVSTRKRSQGSEQRLRTRQSSSRTNKNGNNSETEPGRKLQASVIVSIDIRGTCRFEVMRRLHDRQQSCVPCLIHTKNSPSEQNETNQRKKRSKGPNCAADTLNTTKTLPRRVRDVTRICFGSCC